MNKTGARQWRNGRKQALIRDGIKRDDQGRT
jgi:hypothetical protein